MWIFLIHLALPNHLYEANGYANLLRAIISLKPKFFFLVVMQHSNGISIGNGNSFGWPREAGDRYGEQEEEKSEAGTTHAGLPWIVIVFRCLPHGNQESNPGKITYSSVFNKQYHCGKLTTLYE